MTGRRTPRFLVTLGLIAAVSTVFDTGDAPVRAASIADCPAGTTDTYIRSVANNSVTGSATGTQPNAIDLQGLKEHGSDLWTWARRDSSVTVTAIVVEYPNGSRDQLRPAPSPSFTTSPNPRQIVFCLGSTARPAATLTVDSQTYPDADDDGVSDSKIIAPGPMTIRMVATNTGNVPLTAAGIVTPSGVTGFSCTPAKPTTLPPGATMTCTGTHTVTQAEIDAGAPFVVDGVFRGTVGSTLVEERDTLTTRIAQIVGLTIDKTSTSHPDTDDDGVADAELISPGTIVYQFTLENTGNVDLTNLDLDDPFLDRVACTLPATLAPSTTFQCTGEADINQTDIDAGIDIINTVTVTATGAGRDVHDTDSYGIAVDRAIRPTITKTSPNFPDTNGDGTADANAQLDDVVDYDVVVTNSGNVSFTVSSLTDTVSNGDSSRAWTETTCDADGTTLAPGGTWACSGTFTVTQSDIDAGGPLLNTATVVVTGANGATTDVSAHYQVPLLERSTLAVRKTSPTTAVDLTPPTDSQDVDFSVEIENTGTTTLTVQEVSDTYPLACPDAVPFDVAPGATVACATTVTVDRTLFDAETSLINRVSVRATDPGGADVTGQALFAVPFQRTADLTLVKTADAPYGDADADGVSDDPVSVETTVTYGLDVTNSGNVTLTDVDVDDPDMSGLTCAPTAPATLAPGDVMSCSGTQDIVQADLDAGGDIINTATVTGTGPDGDPVSDTDTYDIPIDADPKIGLTTTSTNYPDIDGDQTADTPLTGDGDIDYEIVAENTGTTTLTDVTVTDPDIPVLSCIPAAGATLLPGESMTCTGTISVDQTRFDLNAPVANTATVTATESAPDQSTYTVKVSQQPIMGLTKTTTTASVTAVDEVVPYELIATNNGNTTFTNVIITDDRLATPLSCTPATGSTLLPGESMTCTGTYTTTQADFDSGHDVVNSATARGTAPFGSTWFGRAWVSVPVDRNPSVALFKDSTNYPDGDADGVANTSITGVDTVNYEITAENDGNITLDGVTVTDPRLSGILCTPTAPATLAPGATMSCTGSLTVDQAEIDGGQPIDNVAGVTSTQGASASAAFSIPNTASPKISVTKTPASPAPITAEGDVDYEFVVTNVGAETLTDVTVSDDLIPGLVCGPVTLAPAEDLTCNGTYTVTQAEIDAGGSLRNEAIAYGTTPRNSLVRARAYSDIPIQATRSLTLDKNSTNYEDDDADGVSNTPLTAPGTIVYSFEITNAGTATLTDVQLIDPEVTALDCPASELLSMAPGDVVICTATRAITQPDIDAGVPIENTAIVFAPSQGAAATDSHEVPIERTPDLTLTKVASGPFGDADDNHIADTPMGAPATITYELVATNTGNQTLTNVSIADPTLGTLSCTQPVDLAPGEQLTCTGTFDVDQGRIDSGSPIVNLADAGSDEGVTDRAAYVVPVLRAPGIVLAKTSPTHPDTDGDGVADVPITAAGDVDYQLTARNVGNVTLTDVTIDDFPFIATLNCTPELPATLAPGESVTCTGTHDVGQLVIDFGSDVINTASVTAVAGSQTLTDRATYDIPIERTASISAVKSATAPYGDLNGDGVADAAVSSPGTVTYLLLVTNTGNVTVTGLDVEDVITGASITNVAMTCPVSFLSPGGSTTCTVDYSVTQADIDNILPIDDIATATATPAAGGTVSASSAYLVPVLAVSELTVRKSVPANPDTDGDFIGDAPMTGPGTVDYEIVVGNSGTVDLTDIAVVDTVLTTLTCPSGIPFDLAPGAVETCSGQIVVSQTDFDTGYVPPFGGDPVAGIINVAVAVGFGPETPPAAVGAAWVAAVAFDRQPSIRLTKTSTSHPDGNDDGVADAAITAPGAVTYQLVAINDGNVTLTEVEIDDPGIATLSCTPAVPATLAPGASITCTGTASLDQAAIDAGGDHVNVATVRSNFAGHEVSDRAVYDLPIGTSPGLTLTKTSTSHPDTDDDGIADTAITAPGTVTYQLVAINDGNVTLSGVTVTDLDVTGLSCTPAAPASLTPGATMTCTGTHTITQGDVDAGGDHVNIATATGTAPTGGSVSDNAAYDIPIDQVAAMTVTKTPNEQTFPVGETATITWTITVRNTGNVTLTDVTTDSGLIVDTGGSPAPLIDCNQSFERLAPGDSRTYTCTTTRTIAVPEIAKHVRVDATSPTGPVGVEAVAVIRSQAATTTTTTPPPGAGVPSPTVPPTGGNTGAGVVLGLLFLAAGVSVLAIARRPRRHPVS